MKRKTVVLSRKGFDSSAGGMYLPLLSQTGEYAFLPRPEPDHMITSDYTGIDYASIPTDFPNFENLRELLDSRNKVPEHGAHLDPDLTRVTSVSGWEPAFGQRSAAQGYLRNRDVREDSEGTLFLFLSRFTPWNGKESGLTEGYYIYGWLEVGKTLRPSEEEQELGYHPHSTKKYREATNNIIYVASDNLSGNQISGAGMFKKLNENLRLSHNDKDDLLKWKLPDCCFESFSRLKNYESLNNSYCLADWPQTFGQAAVCSGKTAEDEETVEKVRNWAVNKIKTVTEEVGVKRNCL